MRTTVKSLMVVLGAALLLGSGGKAHALTLSQFAPVQDMLTNEIATLEGSSDRQDKRRLHTLERAEAVLSNSSTSDGKALRQLSTILHGDAYSSYAPALSAISANLVSSFQTNYQFAASLLPQVPPTRESHAVENRFNSLAPVVDRINNATSTTQVGAILDPARRRLDSVLLFIAQHLTFHLPNDLTPDTVRANINGLRFRVSANQATDNNFSAVTDGTNLVLYVHAVDGTISPSTGSRAITFTVPAGQVGSFTYQIPTEASLTNHTGVYTASEAATPATSGSIFITVLGNEVWGSFAASGDGFDITDGVFRITLTQPE